MKTTLLTLGMVLLGLALLPTNAPAWADGGHKATAVLAWSRLGETERAWVTSLLEQHPLWEEHFQRPMEVEIGTEPDPAIRQKWIFAQAAVWPDIIRGPRGAEVNPWEKWHRPTWHYIDFPIFANAGTRNRLGPDVKPGAMDWRAGRADFLETRLNAVQVLKKSLHELTESSLPAPLRAVMVCWLFHVLGDVHQPCHCATLFDLDKLPTGDRGANGTHIAGLPDRPLHAFWDNLPGSGVGLESTQHTVSLLLSSPALTQSAEARQAELSPEVWVKESHALAQTHVYTAAFHAALPSAETSGYTRDGKTFGSVTVHLAEADLAAYQANAMTVARERIVIAGFRLSEAVRRCHADQLTKPR